MRVVNNFPRMGKCISKAQFGSMKLGKVYQFKRGVDFDGKIGSFAASIRVWASKSGSRAKIRTNGEHVYAQLETK